MAEQIIERRKNMLAYKALQNDRINHAMQFAIIAHGNQVRKGNDDIPYVFHCFDVANEVLYYSGLPAAELEDASVDALLHDVVEDTAVTHKDVENQFGIETSLDIQALSKNEALSDAEEINKEASLRENIIRIKERPIRVACAKLGDRNSNLKVFPAMWSREKVAQYLNESKIIADELGYASEGLHARLLSRIADARVMLSLRN